MIESKILRRVWKPMVCSCAPPIREGSWLSWIGHYEGGCSDCGWSTLCSRTVERPNDAAAMTCVRQR